MKKKITKTGSAATKINPKDLKISPIWTGPPITNDDLKIGGKKPKKSKK